MNWREYLNDRGISDDIIDFAELDYKDPWIRIPYFAEPGRPIKGRWFPSITKETDTKYLWLEGSPVYPYLFQELRDVNIERLCITEGEFDCLVLRQAFKDADLLGKYKVISVPLGVNCWKEEWTRNLGSKILSNITVLFDNDQAGKNGIQALANRLQVNVRKVVWPEDFKEGGDISDFWKFHKENFIEELKKLLVDDVKVTKIKDNFIVRKYPISDLCELEQIKKEIPIENEINKAGIRLTKTLFGYKAHCPWHEDRVPSFMIYTKTNSFYCYSCGKGGSVIDFLIHLEDKSVNSVIRDLRFRYGRQNKKTISKEERLNSGANGRGAPTS